MKRFYVCLLSLVFVHALSGQEVSSPDGRYRWSFSMERQRLWYSLSFEGRTIISRSELGLDLDNRLFESALGIPNDGCVHWGENLKLTGQDRSTVDTLWTPVYGENARVRDHYNRLVLHFRKGEEHAQGSTDDYDKRSFYYMDIEVRAYDEGVAFRYHFPEQTNGLFLNITGERTSFTFPAGTVATYNIWAQSPVLRAPLSDLKTEVERPVLLQLPDGTHVALLEAAMTDFVRGKYRLAAPDRLQVALYDGAEVMSPYNTPWRVVMAADRAVDLVNHKDLVLNLNPPCALTETAFIRPGKAYRCGTLKRDPILQGIAFARRMNLQYIELDARWYGPEMSMASSALSVSPDRDFTIPEICDSARRHGLGVWLYVNQRALYRQLDDILPLYRRWGVSGIKFGFVQVGNQHWSTWLHEAVKKCAAYGLMVDIHDEYRPTGFSRTYPNLLTQEGIGGNEEMPDATHNVNLAFTRYLCGPADYTLSYYNARIKNTRAHQLAMAAVYYSPLQFMFWYDGPMLYDGGEELSFWRRIPTVFDESRAIAGEVGAYIVQARRSGDTWFVGAMTNRDGRTVEIDTSDFLQHGRRYVVDLYCDDPKLSTRSKVRTSRFTLKAGRKLRLPLLPSGGAAMVFTPQ